MALQFSPQSVISPISTMNPAVSSMGLSGISTSGSLNHRILGLPPPSKRIKYGVPGNIQNELSVNTASIPSIHLSSRSTAATMYSASASAAATAGIATPSPAHSAQSTVTPFLSALPPLPNLPTPPTPKP